ncbi:MAG: hypothetical protein ACR2ME_04955 [Acidimicrobiia bacterium]
MGQTIGIRDQSRVADVLMVNADRSFSGQDGEAYSSAPAEPTTFPGQLAVRLFEVDSSINHVYVMSNTVALRRTGGWDDAAASTATDTITNFFKFYPDA